MAVPLLNAVTVPDAETVATVLSEDAHSRATVPDCSGSISGVSVAESPASSSREDGLMMMLSIKRCPMADFLECWYGCCLYHRMQEQRLWL